MDRFVFLVISLIVITGALITSLPSSRITDQTSTASDVVGIALPGGPPIIRKELVLDRTLTDPEYQITPANENDKFLLAGANKDLSGKMLPKMHRNTMSKIGTVKIDGVEREVWRCHVGEGPFRLYFPNEAELVYIYIMKDPAKYTMDVYVGEKYWNRVPHDTQEMAQADIETEEDVPLDMTIDHGGVQKKYTLDRKADRTPQTQTLPTVDFNPTPLLRNKDVSIVGKIDVYQLGSDPETNRLYGIATGTTLSATQQYAFYVFKRFTPITSGTQVNGNSLQLKRLNLVTVSKDIWWFPDCKPAIYLYPKTTTTVKVIVEPKGYLTLTIPQYPKNGWSVTAHPDGTISSDGKIFPYLYYEAKIYDSAVTKPDKGYVVAYNDLPNLYTELLPVLGLNQKEAQEFKEYWEKTLPKSPYYFVGILEKKITDAIEPLTITPKPDTMIRVRLYFEALTEPIAVQKPNVITPTRSGFSVVEWGGMIKLHNDQPFTCSQ